ncbi:MAG: hypothetical protein WED86_05350 [Chloroflexota bacterium]
MTPRVLLLILALAGCAAPGGETTRSPSIASATAIPSKAAQNDLPAPGQDELTGVLGADSIEGGCTYLEAEDGTRYEVIYPPGWTIDRSSATVRDPTGAVVATAGDLVTVRGRTATDMASICQTGPIFQASEVVSVT